MEEVPCICLASISRGMDDEVSSLLLCGLCREKDCPPACRVAFQIDAGRAVVSPPEVNFDASTLCQFEEMDVEGSRCRNYTNRGWDHGPKSTLNRVKEGGPSLRTKRTSPPPSVKIQGKPFS